MKKCKTCGIEKEFTEFHHHKTAKDGRYPHCKSCCREKAVARYWKDPEEQRRKRQEYVDNNREKVRQSAHEYYVRIYAERKEEINKKNRESYQRNKEHASEYGKVYRQRTKAYQTAKTRKRQALVLQRIPKCADLQEIEKFYEEARRLTLETGIKHEVDHIIPLQGKNVSGFHVEWNLQILTKSENASKRNNF